MIQGYIDSYKNGVLIGWCVDSENKNARQLIQIEINGCLLCTIRADHFRGDLLESGESDGYSGFKVGLFRYLDTGEWLVTARVVGADRQLENSPMSINIEKDGNNTESVLDVFPDIHCSNPIERNNFLFE